VRIAPSRESGHNCSISASHFSLVACTVEGANRMTTGASTCESVDRSSPGFTMGASDGSGGEVGMVKSSVGGTEREDDGTAARRVSAGSSAEDNSSSEGKLVATVTHTSPRPRMVTTPAMVPLEDCG